MSVIISELSSSVAYLIAERESWRDKSQTHFSCRENLILLFQRKEKQEKSWRMDLLGSILQPTGHVPGGLTVIITGFNYATKVISWHDEETKNRQADRQVCQDIYHCLHSSNTLSAHVLWWNPKFYDEQAEFRHNQYPDEQTQKEKKILWKGWVLMSSRKFLILLQKMCSL